MEMRGTYWDDCSKATSSGGNCWDLRHRFHRSRTREWNTLRKDAWRTWHQPGEVWSCKGESYQKRYNSQRNPGSHLLEVQSDTSSHCRSHKCISAVDIENVMALQPYPNMQPWTIQGMFFFVFVPVRQHLSVLSLKKIRPRSISRKTNVTEL